MHYCAVSHSNPAKHFMTDANLKPEAPLDIFFYF